LTGAPEKGFFLPGLQKQYRNPAAGRSAVFGLYPGLFLPVLIYVIDFAFVDFYLSYQFNKYPIISPNYFYKVDRLVYKLNFSNPGKFCNSTVITLLLIFLPQFKLVTAFLAAVLVGVKVFSIHRLNKLKNIDNNKSQNLYRS